MEGKRGSECLLKPVSNIDFNPDDYQAFKTTAQKMDAIMTAKHGQQHQGQAKWSETQDQRLRKELANGIYRQFNEQFKPGSHENDDKFHKQANGNFEKAKQKQ